MNNVYRMIFLLFIGSILNGCWFSIGNSQGLCDGENCNYKEAGVCAGVIDIYKNRHTLENREVTQRWYWFDER